MSLAVDSELKHRKSLIDAVDLTEVIKRLILIDGWQEQYVAEACQQYRNYLFLKLKHGNEYELPPSLDIDEVWHSHILHTEEYVRFCDQAFGHYLHHHPHHRKGALTDMEIGQLFETQTQKLYFEEFGEYIYAVRPVSAVKRIKGIIQRVGVYFSGKHELGLVKS